MSMCRMCEGRPATVRAHIIPKSFFLEDLLPNETLLLATGEPGVPSKKSPIGPYDTNILCESCEASFAAYDNYGYKFFHKPRIEVINLGKKSQATIIDEFDYRLLKLFLLSILWRASVSSHRFYAAVSLGRYEDKVRDLIRVNDPGTPKQFPIFIRQWTYPGELIPMLCPFKTKFDGLTFYQIQLREFIAMIKVDRRPLPYPLTISALHPERSLVLVPKEYLGSREHEIMATLSRKL
jgi:hypothetical protein